MNYLPSFNIYCPVLVKSGVTNLHTMLLSIYEFRENWLSKGHMCLMSVNETTVTLV
jgi:hypothetical protein